MAEAGPPGDRVHDVTIVGAGSVGLLLACLLAQRGLDVVVLERRTAPAAPDAPSRAIGIHPPGLRALDAAGVGAEVRARAVAIRSGRVTCEGRVLGAMNFDADDPVLALPQRETEALLEARLAALPSGGLRRGAAVRGIRRPPGRVELEVEGDDRPVVARFAVGCDGVRSGIRSLLGVDWRRRPGRAHYVMADTRDDTREADVALLHFEPAGVVESFPLPGGRRRVVAWVRRPVAEPAPDLVATVARARVGAEFDTGVATGATGFTAQQHLADRFAVGRVALAGDAAHEISPIGGQGMNLGWLDAVDLAGALASALAADGEASAPLDGYARRRRRAAVRAQRQAAFNMAMGAPVAGPRLRIRNAAVRVLAVPPLRALLARAFTMRWL